MGTWGTGIYGNDTAEDVREFCNEIFPLVSVEEGNRIVFREFKDILEDDLIDDDYASFWYSLADWQWKHGILCEDIRMKTIQLLNDHAGIQDWEESARKSDVRKRKAVMDRLKFQLQNTMPPKKLPKAKLSKPKHKPGDIIIFRAKEKENDDELGWERSVGYIPFEYDSQYIRNSSPYYSGKSEWYLDLWYAFHAFFEEKQRLLGLNMEIDTLLDANKLNPILRKEVRNKPL